MQIRLASYLQIDSIVDGPGIRTVIWTQGCKHNCPGCHNPSTHSFEGGELVDVNDVIEAMDLLENQDGITFSGGDPFYQAKECAYLAKHAHNIGLNVWCYTGFTYEQLMILGKKDESILKFLNQIDVLVDGPFIMEKRSQSAKFKGSTNQRVIDVKKSLEEDKIVLYYKEEESIPNNFGRYNNNLYI